MKHPAFLLSLPAIIISLASCGQNLENKDTLVSESHAYLSAIFGDTLKADRAYMAACYDNPNNIALMARLIAVPVEQSFYGGIMNEGKPVDIDRRKGQALLHAWLTLGIRLREPLTMLYSADINANPAFGVMEMTPEEVQHLQKEAFTLLRDMPGKNADQWKALLLCHLWGRGTEPNPAAAKEIYDFLEQEAAAGHIPALQLPAGVADELKQGTP